MQANTNRVESTMFGGFTLIELLIVIAIVLILIAIAVPNFLDARIRATVTKVKGNFHTFEVALEMYFHEHNSSYPYQKSGGDSIGNYRGRCDKVPDWWRDPYCLIREYLTSDFDTADPFKAHLNTPHKFYQYGSGKRDVCASKFFQCKQPYDTWLLESVGPDGIVITGVPAPWADKWYYTVAYPCWPWKPAKSPELPCGPVVLRDATSGASLTTLSLLYSPTNGTKSRGEIMRAAINRPNQWPLDEWAKNVNK